MQINVSEISDAVRAGEGYERVKTDVPKDRNTEKNTATNNSLTIEPDTLSKAATRDITALFSKYGVYSEALHKTDDLIRYASLAELDQIDETERLALQSTSRDILASVLGGIEDFALEDPEIYLTLGRMLNFDLSSPEGAEKAGAAFAAASNMLSAGLSEIESRINVSYAELKAGEEAKVLFQRIENESSAKLEVGAASEAILARKKEAAASQANLDANLYLDRVLASYYDKTSSFIEGIIGFNR